MSDSWGDDSGASEEPRPPLVLPLIATFIVAALLLVFAFAMPRGLDIGHNDSSIIGALISGCMVSLILWGIAFAITIRRAGGGWQVGTLLFILVLGVGSQIVAITLAAHRISGDMATVAGQFRAISAGNRAPDGTGPVSRISAVFLNGNLDDRRAFDREVEARGVLQLLNHEGLTHASPVLHHCAGFEALAARARTIGADGWNGHFAEARRIADAAVQSREITAGDAATLFASMESEHGSYQRQWALDAEMIEDAQEFCALLARRPWVGRGNEILFPNPADLSEARFHMDRIRQNADEERIAADASRRDTDEAAGRLEAQNGPG
jgi:hypothetical protein